MLVTPRLYQQFKVAEQDAVASAGVININTTSWRIPPPDTIRRVERMLLVHQTGSVRVGEVVRQVISGYCYTSRAELTID